MNRLQTWWHGKSGSRIASINGRKIVIASDQEWHWTARASRALVFFVGRNWKVFFAAGISVIVALLSLKAK